MVLLPIGNLSKLHLLHHAGKIKTPTSENYWTGSGRKTNTCKAVSRGEKIYILVGSEEKTEGQSNNDKKRRSPLGELPDGPERLGPSHRGKRRPLPVVADGGVRPIEALSLEAVIREASLVVDPFRVDVLIFTRQHAHYLRFLRNGERYIQHATMPMPGLSISRCIYTCITPLTARAGVRSIHINFT